MSNTNNKEIQMDAPVFMRAVDKYIETAIVSAAETKVSNKSGRIVWGDRDAYPDYLLNLYRDVATLGSIVNGAVDYVAGNEVTLVSDLFRNGICNRKGELAVDIVRGCALDWFIFGGFALEVIRGRDGKPVEIYNMDLENIRTNEDLSAFWYSDNWAKGGRGSKLYPSFMPNLDWMILSDEERSRAADSVVYVKNSRKQVYPLPLYAQAVKSCETERCIDEYHLNSITNGFAASVMIQLCNQVPTDPKLKAEIEKDFEEKFGGPQNAGRIMLTFAPDRQHSAIVNELKTEDFGARYDALAKRCRQQIFTSFRANPNLFGIPTESLGFSAEEYDQAFDLFNRTQIRPVQSRIADAFDRICGVPNVLNIVPFSLSDSQATQTVE